MKILGFISKILKLKKIFFFFFWNNEKKYQVVIKENLTDFNFLEDDLVEINYKKIIKKKKFFEIECKIENIKLLDRNKNFIKKGSKEFFFEYQHLNIRHNENLKKKFIFKNYVLKFIYNYFWKRGYFYFDTPILSYNSKEGANLFKVKNSNDSYFYLSQSPQIYKEAIIQSGFFKYFQISKCFRKEDLRKDRQPEFLQLDLEEGGINSLKKIIFICESFLFDLFNKFKKEFKILRKEIFFSKDKILNKFLDLRFEKIFFSKKLNKYLLKINLKNFLKLDKKKIRNNKIFDLKEENEELIFIFSKEKKEKFYDIYFNEIKLKLIKNFKKKEISFVILKNPYIFQEEKLNFSIFNKTNFEKEKKKEEIFSESFDIILNGIEIVTGAVREMEIEKIKKLSLLLNVDFNKEIKLLKKLFYFSKISSSGFGLGIDRMLSIIFNEKEKEGKISEFIFFYKNKKYISKFEEIPSKK